jgi:hypothetical protein
VTEFRPVDLAAQQVPQLQASRWAVVWWCEVRRRESHFDDKALAVAYAAAHHGLVVPLAALAPWPTHP